MGDHFEISCNVNLGGLIDNGSAFEILELHSNSRPVHLGAKTLGKRINAPILICDSLNSKTYIKK